VISPDALTWSLESISEALAMNPATLSAALAAISTRGYAPFVKVKGHKRRVIHAPRPWLKKLQKRAYKEILLAVPVSEASYSRPGRGVVANAQVHLGNPHMTVLDVQDCFPSTSTQAINSAFQRLGASVTAAATLTRLITHRGVLPQGPPTSPAVLDVVFEPIDEAFRALARENDAVYSRYMDDLAFSGNKPLSGLSKEVAKKLRKFGYNTNPAKRRVWGPSDPHTLTNIVLKSSSLHPTQEYLSAVVYQIRLARRGDGTISHRKLEGMVSWVSMLDARLGSWLRARLRAAR
jgi:RNA-directed DNA polymerase